MRAIEASQAQGDGAFLVKGAMQSKAEAQESRHMLHRDKKVWRVARVGQGME